jgi:hypothetical protein
MENHEEIMVCLQRKLELSVEYGRILDRQFDALSGDDMTNMPGFINEMDECYAGLRDVEGALAGYGFKHAWEDLPSGIPGSGNPGLTDIFLRTREITREIIAKIGRNRDYIEEKRENLTSDMQELTHSAMVKNYFDRAESGNFLSFSG